jgi:hypothetical protein
MQLDFSVGKNVRPFVDEFMPHGLFALDTLRESKIRAALLGRIAASTLACSLTLIGTLASK